MSFRKSSRRSWLQTMLYGTGALFGLSATNPIAKEAPIDPKDKIKVTKIETFVLKNCCIYSEFHGSGAWRLGI
jgi:hypothetical protein